MNDDNNQLNEEAERSWAQVTHLAKIVEHELDALHALERIVFAAACLTEDTLTRLYGDDEHTRSEARSNVIFSLQAIQRRLKERT